MTAAWLWLLYNLISIAFLAFFSMVEMACVSLNKVRLHYYVHKKNRRAQWIHYLLVEPSRLFGTTLIGVNIALFVGSECSRQFYQAIGLSPDLAPLTQVFAVVVFGELAPMFAARHYAESVAMLGSPWLFFSAKMLTPVLRVVRWVSDLASQLLRHKRYHGEMFLSREELQKILEEHGEEVAGSELQEFNVITQKIFHLRHERAKEIMTPLSIFPKLASNATVADMSRMMEGTNVNLAAVYHKEITNIIGIVSPRDLIRASDSKRVRDFAKSPWFITENSTCTEILEQFRKSSRNAAVILDKKGKGRGIITLEDLVSEIFGEFGGAAKRKAIPFMIERTFSGEMPVAEFNKMFQTNLKGEEGMTLSSLIEQHLGRFPEEGESVVIASFELTAEEVSFTGVKLVTIRSIYY